MFCGEDTTFSLRNIEDIKNSLLPFYVKNSSDNARYIFFARKNKLKMFYLLEIFTGFIKESYGQIQMVFLQSFNSFKYSRRKNNRVDRIDFLSLFKFHTNLAHLKSLEVLDLHFVKQCIHLSKCQNCGFEINFFGYCCGY